VLSLKHQIAPPPLTCSSRIPECDLDYVPNRAREMRIHLALSNSFGFGEPTDARVPPAVARP